MGLVWWILPVISALIGLMLLFAGFGRLAQLKPASGGVRLLLSTGFLGLAGIVAVVGLHLQTYKRLIYERPVANVKFEAVEGQEGTYLATVILSDGTDFKPLDGSPLVFQGNEFLIGAQVIKFKPMANLVGYDSVYRLDFIRSLDTGQFNAQRVTKGTVDGINFYDNEEPGISVRNLARSRGAQFGLEDAQYGSATYQPMGDGFEYDVNITQDALIARPTEATKLKIQTQSYPGFQTRGKPDQ